MNRILDIMQYSFPGDVFLGWSKPDLVIKSNLIYMFFNSYIVLSQQKLQARKGHIYD